MGGSSLLTAVELGLDAVAKLQPESGANPNCKGSNDDRTPLLSAAIHNYAILVEILPIRNAKI
jgi:ankyrin repeat protein